jgi:hypothetical protein
MGKKRVVEYTDHGAVRARVAFAAGETSRAITGYSPVAPTVHAIEGSIGTVTYDETSHLFQVPVMAGTGSSASIRIATSPRKPPRRR